MSDNTTHYGRMDESWRTEIDHNRITLLKLLILNEGYEDTYTAAKLIIVLWI